MAESTEFDPKSVPEFSEASFWSTIKQKAKLMGDSLLVSGFTLYYTLQDSQTPKWAKGVILGALAYLIFPADAIPDVIPVVGFTDDLGAIAAASATVAAHITEQHKDKAKEQVKTLLG